MAKTTVGKYLVTRLEQMGLKHIFGIPGDYVLDFYDLLVASKLKIVGTSTEIGAGYAADGYARVNGLGAMCVTYCVGGLNAVNAVAGAYVEKSPLVVISGAPAVAHRGRSLLLHHAIRDYRTQLEIYEKVTVASVILDDPAQAPAQIDACLASCLQHKRPVYFEIPTDMVDQACAEPGKLSRKQPRSDPHALAEAIAESTELLKKARRRAVLGGIEIHRYGLQDKLIKLIEKTGFPIASTLLGKSIISELHPNYIGVYEGALGQQKVTKAIENADCLLTLGALMTDLNLGVYTANLDTSRMINATNDRISIKHHHYDGILLSDFIKGLSSSLSKGKNPILAKPGTLKKTGKTLKPFVLKPKKACTVQRVFQRVNGFIDDNTIVICDIGDSLFGAADLTIHASTEFLSPAYYTSMGFAVPAAIGAQVKKRKLRPLVFVGDGAFQMTGMEVSTIARYGLNPIIVILNNKGYTTERYIREGPYNDIHDWAFHKLPELLRAGWGCEVRTEGEFEEALATAKANSKSYSILNIHLDKMDCSRTLDRLGMRLARMKTE